MSNASENMKCRKFFFIAGFGQSNSNAQLKVIHFQKVILNYLLDFVYIWRYAEMVVYN